LPITSESVVLVALAAGLGSAAIVDSMHRRIPNVISLGTAVAGMALAGAGLSGVSLESSVIGFVLGFAMMLPGFIFGGTGAGDVKLFAGAGAVVGAGRVIPAFVFMAIAGGALALGIAWWRGRLWHTVKSTACLFGRPAAAKASIERSGEHNKFPYGPAIAVGCVMAALILRK
jgi:prepilin peptidase CpaA